MSAFGGESRHDRLRESAFAVAFGSKADMPFCSCKCPLVTQSGHRLTKVRSLMCIFSAAVCCSSEMPLASEQAYVVHMPPALPGVSQSATTFSAGRVCAAVPLIRGQEKLSQSLIRKPDC